MGDTDVFVVGLDDAHRATLDRLPGAAGCSSYPLLGKREVRGVDRFAVEEWLDRARRVLAEHPRPIGGIVGYWDFPVPEMVATLAGEHGLPAAAPDAVARLQHKYWARLTQREVAPECVPDFESVDPFARGLAGDGTGRRGGARPGLAGGVRPVSLDYPFWLKPVRSFRSHLGFRVRSRRDLEDAVEELRARLPRLAEPYEALLADLALPPEVRAVGGRGCVAESIIGGRQCTVEGWSHRGEVHVYGAVDSIREPNRSTFARYQYPSRLPRPVLERMAAVAERIVSAAGYTDAAFNAELLWDRAAERVWIVEVNARPSESHFDLFEKVDGLPNVQVALDLALGRRPDFPHREGRWPLAAKQFIRSFSDAVVTRVPSSEEIAEIEAGIPGVTIQLDVEEGDRLSDLPDQEAYSFELGHVDVGAGSERDAIRKHRACLARLPLELEPLVSVAS